MWAGGGDRTQRVSPGRETVARIDLRVPGGPVAHYDLGYVPALDYTPGVRPRYTSPPLASATVGHEPAPARTDLYRLAGRVALPYSLLVLSAHAKKARPTPFPSRPGPR